MIILFFKDFTPIIEKDGRVRHIKGLSEEVKDNSLGIILQ